jgi:two-component system response regulator
LNGPTILLIEDDAQDAESILDGLCRTVPREHIEVCRDGGGALDFFQRRGDYAGRKPEEVPMLALLDLTLPDVPGLEVLRTIRESDCRLLPVIVLAGSNDIDAVRKAAELGANSFIRKPEDRRELAETLGQLAGYWLELNIPPPCCAGQ